jgi:hypothetical protein
MQMTQSRVADKYMVRSELEAEVRLSLRLADKLI